MLGAQASTSAVNVGDERLPRTRTAPRFASQEQHSKNWQEAGRKVPAKPSAVADAVRCAEQIMKVIDDRWPWSMRHILGGALMESEL